MGPLGQSQGFGQKRDTAGGLPARRGHPAVHPPEVRQPGRIGPFARIGRPAQRLGRLPQIVLEQPRLRQRAPDLDLVLATQARLPKRPDEQRRGLGPMSLFQSLDGAVVQLRHARVSIPGIQPGNKVGLPGDYAGFQ